jgi:hypothetical protein
MISSLEPFVVLAIGAIALVVLLVVLNRLLVRYRMGEASFEALLLGFIPVVRVRYECVIAAEAVPMRRFLFHTNPFRTVSLGNRVFARRFVHIHRPGWFGHVVITPSNPEAFVHALKERMVAAGKA